MPLRISKSICCVFGCSSKKGNNPELSFHRFPKTNETFVIHNNHHHLCLEEKFDRRKTWILAIKTTKEVTQSMRICSRHFLKTDFILPDAPAVRRKLKKTAVPSLHLPKGTHENETKRRSLTKINSSSNINRSLDGHTTQQNVTSNKNDSATSVFDVEQSAVEALLLLSTQYNPHNLCFVQDILKKD